MRAGVGRGASIVIGLSGGGDSVALTSALLALRKRMGLKLAAAHLNHRLRGAESDRDEEFVRAMCARLGLELQVERAEGLGAISGANLEERARDARREFLGRAADRVGADFIALGHHRDDQAETVLMRLMRGAGAAGMAAMAERGPERLIRPMLSISRAEIREYLDACAIPFVEDSSNSSRDFLRNRIRGELIPMLERDYAPGSAHGWPRWRMRCARSTRWSRRWARANWTRCESAAACSTCRDSAPWIAQCKRLRSGCSSPSGSDRCAKFRGRMSRRCAI